MSALIVGHVWRPPNTSGRNRQVPGSLLDQPCAFTKCGRMRDEHERAVSGYGRES